MAAAQGKVCLISHPSNEDASGHDYRSRVHSAQRIAQLLGLEYVGDYSDSLRNARDLYFVPDRTLQLEEAHSLGINSPSQLFGGVVPHPYMTTKAITHQTVGTDARAPEGWSASLASRIEAVVLPGYTAFSTPDAIEAARRLLRGGAVRIKRVNGIGGTGQTVVDDLDGANAFLGTLGNTEIAELGVVLERNLNESVTYSIGSLTLGEHQVSYYGTQRSTKSHHGSEVYGGSDLVVVRGTFADLAKAHIPIPAYRAMTMAMQYDIAISQAFPEFFASRRNYDVIDGYDDAGAERTGVLEQSWRYGGASPAEISAIEAFAADPSLNVVRASTFEVHADQEAPHGALTYYRDTDPHVGALTKYCKMEPYGNPA